MSGSIDHLTAGMEIIYDGNKTTTVSTELASAFRLGDRLIVLQDSGDLLHIPQSDWDIAAEAVGMAYEAFIRLGKVSDDQISDFYESFAVRLENDGSFAPIAAANREDVEKARAKGRSTTRLLLSDKMRSEMVEGLRLWKTTSSIRGMTVDTVAHDGWSVSQKKAGLGVVGFVFEGRPNVFADATGVLRSGNTVVFRIGSDALGTARAISEYALRPALDDGGLPEGSVSLVESESRAAGWAMFADKRLALAVARGSGEAVRQLGSVALQSGNAVSLHGTGGAWMMVSESADPSRLEKAVFHSLDRKVCNTLNTVIVTTSAAPTMIPVVLAALEKAARRRENEPKLHFTEQARQFIPASWFKPTLISRASGSVTEPKAEVIDRESLGQEWEWENSPEITLSIVSDIEEAVVEFNRLSPRFVVSFISEDQNEQDLFFDMVDSPFVGNGFTRWVDGQYALGLPELGLSNWQNGRLLGRGGILSGSSVFTVRSRVTQIDPDIGR